MRRRSYRRRSDARAAMRHGRSGGGGDRGPGRLARDDSLAARAGGERRPVPRVRQTGRRAGLPEVDGALFWFEVLDTLGRPWRVWLVTDHTCPEIVGHWGFTSVGEQVSLDLPGARHILINALASRRTQDRTLIHELTHAAGWGAEIRPGAEEKFVRKAEGNMLKFVTSCGFKSPRRPRGYAALRRVR